MKTKVAIIGSGNIGTDLMIKILRLSKILKISVFVGIDPGSDGLARAKKLGVTICSTGINGLIKMSEWKDIKIVFDATSAKAHAYNWNIIEKFQDKKIIDLTPAAIGPLVVPSVNFPDDLGIRNTNMVTCGGQATIPVIAAISQVAKVHYGEIIASMSSKSAGPGTRANIDEFTKTTATAIQEVGGATIGKAIIVLNPGDPPIVMRNTVYTLSENADRKVITDSIKKMVNAVQKYVTGYALQQEVQFEDIPESEPVNIPGLGLKHGLRTSVYLKVEGSGHYLPKYAGNLDIMTSAALATAEKMLEKSKISFSI